MQINPLGTGEIPGISSRQCGATPLLFRVVSRNTKETLPEECDHPVTSKRLDCPDMVVVLPDSSRGMGSVRNLRRSNSGPRFKVWTRGKNFNA